MSVAAGLAKCELNREYQLVDFGHTIQLPPAGALVRISRDAGKYKATSYVVVQGFKPTTQNASETNQLVGVDVFACFAKLQTVNKDSLQSLCSNHEVSLKDIRGPAPTVAVLAEDFFAYLATAKTPLSEQFPPPAGFSVGLFMRQPNPDYKPPYLLGTAYELDAFEKMKRPKKGALLQIKWFLAEDLPLSMQKVVFDRLERITSEKSAYSIRVFGLDLDRISHTRQLAVCGNQFFGSPIAVINNDRALLDKRNVYFEVTVLAENYFEYSKQANSASSSETTDSKTPES